jgi:UDP-glucoronosyl and UDP-glucosyl transferase
MIAHKLAHAPLSPSERFVRWVEFAAEYPDLNELNLPFHELSTLVYYSLDVIAVSLLIALAVVGGTLTLLVFAIRWLWRRVAGPIARRFRPTTGLDGDSGLTWGKIEQGEQDSLTDHEQ